MDHGGELTAVGCVPFVIDACEVRLKAQRPTQQSDRRDACELCELRITQAGGAARTSNGNPRDDSTRRPSSCSMMR